MTDDATTDDPAVEPDVDDKLHLLDSGRVRFVMDGQVFTLRRPKLGEVRGLRAKLSEQRESMEADARAGKFADALARVDADQQALLDWVAETFKLLGDKRLPKNTDDLPPWLLNTRLPAQLIAHWQRVPLDSGDASTPIS